MKHHLNDLLEVHREFHQYHPEDVLVNSPEILQMKIHRMFDTSEIVLLGSLE